MSRPLSTAEAAAYLECSEGLVRRHARRKLIGKQVGERSYVFTKAELAAFKRKKRPPGKPKG